MHRRHHLLGEVRLDRRPTLLRDAELDDKLWIIGGNLPEQDHARLRELGFSGIFPTGSTLTSIVEYIEAHGSRR